MLSLKYPPSTWSEFVCTSDQVAKLREQIADGRFERGVLWIGGPSGAGKSTLAQLLVQELGVDDSSVILLDGVQCTVEAAIAVADGLHLRSLWSKWRAVIVDEAHCMTTKAVQVWLTALQRLPENVLIVFTSTEDPTRVFKEFAEPFMSRCRRIELVRPDEAGSIARMRAICELERIDATDEQLERILTDSKGNLRASIEKLADLPIKRDRPIVPAPVDPIAQSPPPWLSAPIAPMTDPPIEPPKPDPEPSPIEPMVAPEPTAPVIPPSPPARPAEERERERLEAQAERQRRIAERVAQASMTAPDPIRPIKPAPVTPPISASALVDALKLAGTKCTLDQAEILLSACAGSIDALEKLVKIPLRQPKPAPLPASDDTVCRGGKDRKKPKDRAAPKPKEKNEEKPTTNPETWRVIVPSLVVLLWVSWPWVSLSAELAIWSIKSIISVYQYIDR